MERTTFQGLVLRKVRSKNAKGRMKILEVTEVTDEIVSAFQYLVPQLAAAAAPPGWNELNEIVNSPTTMIFIARDPLVDDAIVGTLTLAIYRIPTGVHAWIEDVVVDTNARGRGIGEALCGVAMEHAAAVGAAQLDLTSRPSRESANRLYQRLGFELRKTNVYRYTF
jgi:ribosomal protein S18 acetylase RimI-like enzyme